MGRRHQKKLDEESLNSDTTSPAHIVSIIETNSANKCPSLGPEHLRSKILSDSDTNHEPDSVGESRTFSSKSVFVNTNLTVKSVTNILVANESRHSWDFGRKSIGDSEETIKRKSLQHITAGLCEKSTNPCELAKRSTEIEKMHSDPIDIDLPDFCNAQLEDYQYISQMTEIQSFITCSEIAASGDDIESAFATSVNSRKDVDSCSLELQTASRTDTASFLTCPDELAGQELDEYESYAFEETIS